MTGHATDVFRSAEHFEAFEEALRRTLLHLYDPGFQVPHILYDVMGCDPAEGIQGLRTNTISSIGTMEPEPGVPSDSRARRYYEALHQRFVMGLTQEETAERLHLSVRHLQRVQREATDVLTRHLWERWLVRKAAGGTGHEGEVQPQESRPAPVQAPDWRSQADLELAFLRESEPEAVADVMETIQGVLELENALASEHGVRLEAKFVQSNLVAAVHPSALRQTLITAVGRLARHSSPGQIAIYASLEDGKVKITVTASIAPGRMPADHEFIGDVIAPLGTSVEVGQKGRRVFLWLRVPSVEERVVLVVEDNPDMVLFYRHCTAGTPYRIVHAAPDQDLVDAIESATPDVVVLDVMLPHIDGWQILTHLHERPATRPIPVIICSVVKEEELALALGAARFLSKPIQPRAFVAALDQVLRRASTESPTAPERNEAAC